MDAGELIARNDIDDTLEIERRLAVGCVCNNALAVGRGGSNMDAATDLGTENAGAELAGDLVGQIKNLAGEDEAGGKLVQQDAQNL